MQSTGPACAVAGPVRTGAVVWGPSRRGLTGACWAVVPLQPGWSEGALAATLGARCRSVLARVRVAFSLAGWLACFMCRGFVLLREGSSRSGLAFGHVGLIRPLPARACPEVVLLLQSGLDERSRSRPWSFSWPCGRRWGEGASPSPAPETLRFWGLRPSSPPLSSVLVLPSARVSFQGTVAVPAASRPSPANQTAFVLLACHCHASSVLQEVFCGFRVALGPCVAFPSSSGSCQRLGLLEMLLCVRFALCRLSPFHVHVDATVGLSLRTLVHPGEPGCSPCAIPGGDVPPAPFPPGGLHESCR